MRSLVLLLCAAPLFQACGDGLTEDSSTKAVPAYTCGVVPACNAAAPRAQAPKGFLGGKPLGKPYHQGHDLFFAEGEDQWVIGQFQYGNTFFKSNLVAEEVKIYALRGCGDAWELLGSAFTSDKRENPPVMGIEDEGGSVYFKIPDEKRLGLGRHRIRLVVSGDQSATELYMEVLPVGTRLVVSDVDGTLTKGELSEAFALLLGKLPSAHPGAADLFQKLVKKGYRPLYLTARAENLLQRTRDFLAKENFPAGIVETSNAKLLGINGDEAIAYKTEALQRLRDRGFVLAYGFGNTDVDDGAFANADIPTSNRFFMKYDAHAGQTIEDYRDLSGLPSAPNLCSR